MTDSAIALGAVHVALLLSSCGNYCGKGIPPTPSLWAASGAHPFVESDADINRERSPPTKKKKEIS